MTKPELLLVMYSIEALMESNLNDKALDVVKKIIKQTEIRVPEDSKNE